MTSGPLHPDRELIIGVTPGARPDGRLVVALLPRAGARRARRRPRPGPGPGRARPRRGPPRRPVRRPARCRRRARADDLPRTVDTVVVADAGLVGPHRAAGRRVLAEVTSLGEARAALAAGADGLVAKGAEAGGRVGERDRLRPAPAAWSPPSTPRSGCRAASGSHTAAAAVAGGAAGVVARRPARARPRVARCPPTSARAVGAMDGSETVVVGGHRVYTRPDLAAARTPTTRPDDVAARPRRRRPAHPAAAGRARTGRSPARSPTATAPSAASCGAVRPSIAEHVAAARELRPLAPGAGIAATRGTVHPIVQGPMTRVSDRAGFAGRRGRRRRRCRSSPWP